MKKVIALILVLLMLVSLTACPAEDTEKDSTKSTSKTDPSTTPSTPSGDPNDNPGEKPNEKPDEDPGEDPNDKPTDDPNEDIVMGIVQGEPGMTYEVVWTQADDTTGILQFAEISTATEADLEGSGLKAPLSLLEVIGFQATYTKGEDGVYVVDGTICAASMDVEGESAAEFIEMMKQSLGDSKLDEMTRKALNGEVLTEKEDIEWLIWEFDTKLQISFTQEGNDLTIIGYTKTYTEWGTQLPIKEVYHIDSGVIRAVDKYERDELSSRMEYRANGIPEKEINYWEGEESSVYYYDENGDMIEN